jgi:hypothetical protein
MKGRGRLGNHPYLLGTDAHGINIPTQFGLNYQEVVVGVVVASYICPSRLREFGWLRSR